MRIAVSYPAISLTKAIAGRHRRPQKRLQTAANPPSTRIRARTIAFVISSHPLPVFSRPQSVSIGGFGLRRCAGAPRRQLRRIHPCRRRTSVLFGRSGFTIFLQSAVDTRRETKNLACTDAVGSARYEHFRRIDTARIDGLVARRPLVPNLPQTQPQRPEMEPNHAAIPSSNGPVAPRDTPTTPTCRPERAEFRSC